MIIGLEMRPVEVIRNNAKFSGVRHRGRYIECESERNGLTMKYNEAQ